MFPYRNVVNSKLHFMSVVAAVGICLDKKKAYAIAGCLSIELMTFSGFPNFWIEPRKVWVFSSLSPDVAPATP